MAQGAPEIEIVDPSGAVVARRVLPSEVFAANPAPHVVYQVIRWQLAKRRAGTHKTRTRAEVTGGGKKPWRQKGTGNARSGSNTSPLWVGGGIAHGPKVRKYEFRLNKKERARALGVILSDKVRAGALKGVANFSTAGKTKDAQSLLSNLGVARGSKVIAVTSSAEQTRIRSLRNIDGVMTVEPRAINAYDVLNAKHLFVFEDALDAFIDRCMNGEAA